MRLNYICIVTFSMLVPFVSASIVVVQDQGVEGLGKISWVSDAALASLLINGLLALPLLHSMVKRMTTQYLVLMCLATTVISCLLFRGFATAMGV